MTLPKKTENNFFVLEFVDGMSLRELMGTYPECKCDIQTILRIGIDFCTALQCAHSQGVLHRDIKPANIMITQEGTAKLMDFGLAKMLGQPSITQEGIIVGTVAYVAPKITLGKDADARSDLYSLGAVLYEAVAGKPPLSPVLTELNRERLLQSAQLKRISFNDVLEMIKQILDQRYSNRVL